MNDRVKVTLFKSSDISQMNLRERDQWLISSGLLETMAEQHAKKGIGYTIWFDEVPVLCGGIDFYWPRVGEAWMLLTEWVVEHPMMLVRITKECMNELIRIHNVKRCQATINTSDSVSIRFCELYGFKREGMLKSYGPDGSDYYMYGRVN
jgi:RimJ/RimL family protein N-acetyltransferase